MRQRRKIGFVLWGLLVGGCSGNEDAPCTPEACGPHQQCVEDQCGCSPGFVENGGVCEATCAACSPNASCDDSGEVAQCSCIEGYQGDGFSCIDIDECINDDANDCSIDAVCTNTPGSFTCACAGGYEGDGVICSDVNECATGESSCGAGGFCQNNQGSYTCICQLGFQADLGNLSCLDVDECATGANNCGANALCENTAGGFLCRCPDGYTGDGQTCSDVDECLDDTNNCDVRASCLNTDGSYTCTCDEGYTGNGTSCSPNFNIELAFQNTPTTTQRLVFEQAKARWEDLITGDIENIPLSAGARAVCLIPSELDQVDDIVISVELSFIDGQFGILGSAGPVCTRAGGPHDGLPLSGIMTFDTADLDRMEADGTLQAVILHEMGHVLGVGPLWKENNLITDEACPNNTFPGNGNDATFTGSKANAAWQSLGGSGGAPVENTLGQGSCDAHWRESGPMQEELMSPVLSTGNQLSIVTLQSLADLGYTVGPNNRADTFSLDALLISRPRPQVHMHDDVYVGPMYSISPLSEPVQIR